MRRPRRPLRRLPPILRWPGALARPQLTTQRPSRRAPSSEPTRLELDPNRDRSAEVRQQFREARWGWT